MQGVTPCTTFPQLWKCVLIEKSLFFLDLDRECRIGGR